MGGKNVNAYTFENVNIYKIDRNNFSLKFYFNSVN